MDLQSLSTEELMALKAQMEGGAKPQSATPSAPVDKSYRGTVLPLRRDPSGNVNIDLSAGLPGMIGRAVKGAWSGFTYPGDVAAGRASPEETGRALATATLMLPTLTPARTGEVGADFLVGAMRKRNIPTTTELKDVGSAGYQRVFGNPDKKLPGMNVDYSPDALKTVASDVDRNFFQRGLTPKQAPETYAIIEQLQNPPGGSVATLANLQALREDIRAIISRAERAGEGKESFAANRLLDQLDRFVERPPAEGVLAGAAAAERAGRELAAARGNTAAAHRSNAITGDLDRAVTGIAERAEGRGEASYSGLNLDNPIRQRVEALLENKERLAGFSPEEIASLEAIRRGGPVRNISRRVGNLLGGGGGLGQSALAAMGAATGAAAGEPLLSAAGAAAPFAIGTGSRMLANALAKRSLSKADELIRKRSPLYESGEAGWYVPGTEKRAALLRALMIAQERPQAQ